MSTETQYVRPRTTEEAIAALVDAGGDGMVVAGGIVVTSLINTHLAKPRVLVDVTGINSMRGVRILNGGELELGALVRHAELLESPEVLAGWPLLNDLARDIACERLRAQGTLGGSLCTVGQQGDPATGLIALGATVCLRGAQASRTVPLERFYTDDFAVDLEEGELLESVRVPPVPDGYCWGFYKLGPRRAMDFTLLSAAVVVQPGSEPDILNEVTIAMSGVAPTALRLHDAEERLRGRSFGEVTPSVLSEWLQDDIAPEDDAVYSSAYKRHMAGVVLHRALHTALNHTLRES